MTFRKDFIALCCNALRVRKRRHEDDALDTERYEKKVQKFTNLILRTVSPHRLRHHLHAPALIPVSSREMVDSQWNGRYISNRLFQCFFL